MGALLADGSYYLLGFSVWWCVAAAVRAWLAALALWLRVGQEPDEHRTALEAPAWWQGPQAQRAAFWLALLVLLASADSSFINGSIISADDGFVL